jgi:hypothetical protein
VVHWIPIVLVSGTTFEHYATQSIREFANMGSYVLSLLLPRPNGLNKGMLRTYTLAYINDSSCSSLRKRYVYF